MMAIGVIRAAAEAGLTVPDELSVVGYDDIQLAQHMHPPLTTLAQDKTGLGVEAAQALLRQIEGADTAEPVTLPVELVVRGSTAAAPSRVARG
jgi:LacI family transcriptional regulator